MKKNVRILLVGEPGVGKTSLVMSLVGEEFPEVVPAKAEEITIPADVTPEKVPTHIVDFSAQEQGENDLMEELHRADVVCIVYAVDADDTLEKVASHWLPLIRRTLGTTHGKPVILVGNKTDSSEISTLDAAVKTMQNFVEVETCVECSAKNLKNISEMFYYAQKSVLHPTTPLYDADKKELTKKCSTALKRIFKICDMDNDGILSDIELNEFQRRCFNAPLVTQALEDVKTVVKRHCSDGVRSNGLTQQGFLALHLLFIQRGRHETTWTVLRRFGYDDKLALDQEYLCPRLRVDDGCSSELTHSGFQFLQTLFEKHDKDRDGCLSPDELAELFSTCPEMPWGADVLNTVCTNTRSWITNSGFLSQWVLTVYLDLPRAMEYLAYMGYLYENDSQRSAIHITRSRQIDSAKKQTNRNVLLCHVIGPKGVGKTHLLQGLLGRNMQYVEANNDRLTPFSISAVNVYGSEKYLLMREIDADITTRLNPGDLTCDVACLAYDVTDPKSFEFCAATHKKHFKGHDVPVLMVACKAEQRKVVQEGELTPEQYCKVNKLPPPQYYSSVNLGQSDLYSKLATLAACPEFNPVLHKILWSSWNPNWLSQCFYRGYSGLPTDTAAGWIKITIGIALAVATGLGIYKLARIHGGRNS